MASVRIQAADLRTRSNVAGVIVATVAETILEQLGSGRFAAMTGAKDFHDLPDKNGLRFRVGRNAKGVNCVVIILDASDTYTVKFLRANIRRVTLLSSVSGVYCDKLQAVFSEHTGMATKF